MSTINNYYENQVYTPFGINSLVGELIKRSPAERGKQLWIPSQAETNRNYIESIYNSPMAISIISEKIVPQFGFLDPISEMFDVGKNVQKDFVLEVYRIFDDYFTRNADFNSIYFAFRTFVFEENCIVIEWVFPDIIFSLNIEEEIEESSWSLISSPNAGDLAIGDYFNDINSIQSVIYSAIDKIQSQRQYARKWK